MNTVPCEFDWPCGVKKTKQRLAVAAALAAADTPLTALELAARLEQRGEAVWLSTVYRILDAFAEKGLVLKTPVLDSGVALYELARDRHRHYAVCVLCNRVVAMENCPMDSFLPRLAEQDFHVLGHRLQMYGYCAACAQDENR